MDRKQLREAFKAPVRALDWFFDTNDNTGEPSMVKRLTFLFGLVLMWDMLRRGANAANVSGMIADIAAAFGRSLFLHYLNFRDAIAKAASKLFGGADVAPMDPATVLPRELQTNYTKQQALMGDVFTDDERGAYPERDYEGSPSTAMRGFAAVAPRHQIPTVFPGNYGKLHEVRRGIMLHYDASANDDAAVTWLLFDARCKVSYTWLVLDDGTVREVAPVNARAWHAGVCRPSGPLAYEDANSAFYGIAIAARPGDKATVAQLTAVAALCATICETHGWTDLKQHITTHKAEAWPRGRKVDPDGVLSVDDVRRITKEMLTNMEATRA